LLIGRFFVPLCHNFEEKVRFMMKKSRVVIRLLGAVALVLLLSGCFESQKQPRAYVSDLTSGDSVSIKMGQYTLLKYHSDRLGLDINYPSYLVHQDLPEDVGMQELFMMDDVSISVMVDSVYGMLRSSGQLMMGMGAELVEVGDDYSIHEGQDDKWEYYGKVIDSDSLRQVTVILRYYPEHADAVDLLRQWVKDFKVE
jgi:hypothetical protein